MGSFNCTAQIHCFFCNTTQQNQKPPALRRQFHFFCYPTGKSIQTPPGLRFFLNPYVTLQKRRKLQKTLLELIMANQLQISQAIFLPKQEFPLEHFLVFFPI